MLTLFLFLQEQAQKVSKSAAEAFAELYTQFLPGVFRYISYRVTDKHMAEDLTSTVFEKALTKFTSYSHEKAAFSTWIFSIARNTVIDHFRTSKQARTVPIDNALSVPDETDSPEDDAVKTDEICRLRTCLAHLPKKELEIFSLKFGAEMTTRQIARTLGLSESNVGTTIFRSVRKLRDDFKGGLDG